MNNLKNLTRRLLKKTIDVFREFSMNNSYKKWILTQGDKTLRLNYPLNESSIVFDVGGYEGQWTSDIYSKYNCTIHIFEPVKLFAQNIDNRFLYNNKIITHSFGLGGKTTTIPITLANDSSSIYITGKKYEQIKIVDIYDFIQQYNILDIDLLKINIEGGEYELLERLITKNSSRR